MNLNQLTIKTIHKGLLKKEFSAKEISQAYLDNIESKNKDIFAYLRVAAKEALEQAEKIDQLISQKQNISILAGIPLAIKDNILVEGLPCTAGSKILENYIAPYDATVVNKLKQQGAVILGKTNLDEFAMGASCEHSAFGPTKNPHDLTRVPGGSSGGSAAAVASNMALAALGSDTGGSIRQPASFCGVVGLKPTYGAVSRYGLIALASSLDQIGPITKTAEDARILFEAIKGRDERDSTSLDYQDSSQINLDIKNLKIGVPKEYFVEGIDSEVEKSVKGAIKKFEEAGAKIREISLPHTKYAIEVYYLVMPSEASSNLARYDGIRYGSSVVAETNDDQAPNSLLDVYLKTRQQYFGKEVKRRIMLGTFTLSAGYYDAYYLRAQKVRTKIKEDFEKAFQKVDVMMTPTSPTVAFKIGEKIENPVTMYLSDIFTASVNLAGLPAISIPCGKKGNLPIGLQIIGQAFQEQLLLSLAEFFEKL